MTQTNFNCPLCGKRVHRIRKTKIVYEYTTEGIKKYIPTEKSSQDDAIRAVSDHLAFTHKFHCCGDNTAHHLLSIYDWPEIKAHVRYWALAAE